MLLKWFFNQKNEIKQIAKLFRKNLFANEKKSNMKRLNHDLKIGSV